MNRRMMLSYLAITAFFLLVVEIPLGVSFADRERDQINDRLSRDAKVLAALVGGSLAPGKPLDTAIIENYEVASGARVLVVDGTGVSVADSDDPIGRNYAPQDEIAHALRGTSSTGTSESPANGHVTYFAVPIRSGDDVVGAVRVTLPTSDVDNRVRRLWLTLAILAVVTLGAVAGVGFLLTRLITRPIEMLRAAGAAFLVGERDIRVPTDDSPALNELVTTFNQMADHIESLEGAQFDAMVAIEQSFVDSASAPLRTPLATLRRHLANLEVTVIPDAREELEAAIAQTAKLTTLVDQLLDLAEIEATGAGKEENVELVASITARCEAWKSQAADRGVQLRIESNERCFARVAPSALDRILDSLLRNAIDAAPTGTAVTIRTEARADFVGIHVIDQGPGMTDDERRHAFDRFWQGPEAEGRGTSGLGLTLVAQLASASNGVAGLTSVPEGGLDAWVELPHPRGDLSTDADTTVALA